METKEDEILRETEENPAPETETNPTPEAEAVPAPEAEAAPTPEEEAAPAPEAEAAPAPAAEPVGPKAGKKKKKIRQDSDHHRCGPRRATGRRSLAVDRARRELFRRHEGAGGRRV